MAWMIDILENALEAQANDTNIWRATRKGNSKALAEKLAKEYSHSDLEPVPLKEPAEFRPAFLSTIEGSTRDLEREFVGKSLFYAHSVAVPDDLALWENLPLHSSDSHWYQSQNVVQVARKIARYAELERAGLLYYVPPMPPGPHTSNSYRRADVKSIAPLVVRYAGVMEQFESSSDAILPFINQWLGELQALLDHVNLMRGNVDLFLPDWFPGLELLEWTLRLRMTPTEFDGSLARGRSVARLIQLPSLDPFGIERISSRELIELRQSSVFERWRHDLVANINALPPEPSLADLDTFLAELVHREGEVRHEVTRSRRLSEHLKSTVYTGLATGLAGWVASQSVAATALTGTAPAIVDLARSAIGWFVRPDNTSPSAPYRMFIDQNTRMPNGQVRPPRVSTFMYSADTGRPTVDFISEFFRGE